MCQDMGRLWIFHAMNKHDGVNMDEKMKKQIPLGMILLAHKYYCPHKVVLPLRFTYMTLIAWFYYDNHKNKG